MLDNLDYDFPTEMVDLEAINTEQQVGKDNYKVPSAMARACVRTDTGQVLGIHGSKYKPISHKDVVDRVMEGVEKTGLTNKSMKQVQKCVALLLSMNW